MTISYNRYSIMVRTYEKALKCNWCKKDKSLFDAYIAVVFGFFEKCTFASSSWNHWQTGQKTLIVKNFLHSLALTYINEILVHDILHNLSLFHWKIVWLKEFETLLKHEHTYYQ